MVGGAVPREVEVYAQKPDQDQDQGGWTSGSGYLLAGRLVLTAAHVVCVGGQALTTVRVRGEPGGLHAARVLWHRHDSDGIDLALLEVTDPSWVTPTWRHPVRFGQFVTGRPAQACEAVGFPHVVATPERRDTHHAVGQLNPKSLVKAGLYAVEVSNPPSAPTADGSGWAGMSGAAVHCAGLLIGVVTVDPAGFDSRRLVCAPITAAFADPAFTALVTEHTGAPPVPEPVELVDLAHPVTPPNSPAKLLRADAATTPFRDRPELQQLLDWCEDPAWSGVRLVTGPGGQGKTRLARHLVGQLTQRGIERGEQGWAAVVLAEQAGPGALAVLRQVTTPTLVIVDYAESRSAQLDPLIEAMDRAEAKVRLLLLARTAGAWRTDRVAPAAHLAVLADDRIVIPLRPVEPAVTGRTQAWHEAVTALAPRLAALPDYRHLPWTTLTASLPAPTLAGESFRTILAVQMHALATLLQASEAHGEHGSPSTARDAREVLLEHEHRYWTRVAEGFGITLNPATRGCLVALATLWGATDAADADRVLASALPAATGPDTRATVAEWLSTLYRDGENYWSGLQPDPLGEYLVATVLPGTQPGSGQLENTTAAVSAGQLEHGLTVLGRAHPQHPPLSDVIISIVLSTGTAGVRAAIAVAPRLQEPAPLLNALNRVVDTADLPALQRLSSALPRFSLLLAGINLRVAGATVGLYRELAGLNRDAHLPALAASVNNLALRLAEAGRRPEALTGAQEAADLYRELAQAEPEVYGAAVNQAAEMVALLTGP